ncbi:MAG TPA: multicopper oxidase family protein [Planctomycetota bacterium]|nr:multicopper oxidase family protein [Planctomycetota bacterium]
MAGLGQHIDTQFSLYSLMEGSETIAGQVITPWFFADVRLGLGGGFMYDRRLPSAHIETLAGAQVNLDLFNGSADDHTIHLHGLDVDQANDGVPQTSFSVPPMQSTTYSFTAPHAGTYMYHCHVDTVLHFARGMYGTIIVRPSDGSTDKAWDCGPTFDEEVLWQLSTYQTSWAILQSSGGATVRMRPDAFLLNGKENPDAVNDVYSRVEFGAGERAYLRLSQMAYQWARVSFGGQPFSVVASDGRPLVNPITATAWELGPGERYDLLLEGFPAGTHTGLVEYLDDATGAVLGSVETAVVVS